MRSVLKSWMTLGWFVAAVGVAVPGMAAEPAESPSLQRVRTEVNAVRADLEGESTRSAEWGSRLGLEELDGQLQAGPEADPNAIGKTVQALFSTEHPVDRRRLTALRDALQSWLAQSPTRDSVDEGPVLEPAEGTDVEPAMQLPANTEEAQTDSPGGMPETGAPQVRAAVGQLRDWMQRNRRRYQPWEEILQLRSIEQAATAPQRATREEVELLSRRVALEVDHWDRSHYVALRRALQDWQAELEAPISEQLAVRARRAKADFRPVPKERLTAARRELKASVQRLEKFLGTGTPARRSAWKRFLRWEPFTGELNVPAIPRVSPLFASYSRLNSGEDGLHLDAFEDVRLALENYLELLQLNETQPSRIGEGKRELQTAVDELDRFLTSGGEEKEQGWKSYLAWNVLQDQLQEDSPNLNQLREVARKFRSDQPGLELSRFQRVAHRLEKYTELVQLAERTAAEDRYRNRLERMAQGLEQHRLDPDNATAAQLTDDLRWLKATGLLPELAAQMRSDFSRDNVFVSLSGDFVTRQISDTICESEPIRRCFEGASVRGTARTAANVRGRLVPAQNGAIIDILMHGRTTINAVAQQRKVYVRTKGNTQLSASKRIYLTPDGLSSVPAVAHATTNQTTQGVCVDRRCGRRLIGRIACRKANESRPRAENEANREARQTIARRMDQQASEMISQANGQLREARSRLDTDLYPERIQMRSTHQSILINALSTAKRYLGAPSDPPPIGTGSDLAIRLHQSAVNNVIAKEFGGIKLDNERLVKLLDEQNLPVPDELRLRDENGEQSGDQSESENWSLVFDNLQPATLTFSDGNLRIAIRGRKFTRGDQTIKEPLEISAVYQLRKSASGELEADRIGDVDIQFLQTPGRLSMEQLTYKTFIKRKTAALFRQRMSSDDLPEGDIKERAKSIKVEQIEATRGWLAVALGLEGLASSLP